ncbi:MAG: hypothetical protein CMN96_07705 [Synechococcus sp. MED850]|nr:hypothetical protein [Synechococcus sp. MED850]
MRPCTVCGGSGIQRVSSQRFRTCLACLGRGELSAAVSTAPLNSQPLNSQPLNGLTTAASELSRLVSVTSSVS